MLKASLSVLAILLSSFTMLTPTDAVIEYANTPDDGFRTNWLADPHRHRIELFKKWLGNKPIDHAAGERSASPYDALHPAHQFKGAC